MTKQDLVKTLTKNNWSLTPIIKGEAKIALFVYKDASKPSFTLKRYRDHETLLINSADKVLHNCKVKFEQIMHDTLNEQLSIESDGFTIKIDLEKSDRGSF